MARYFFHLRNNSVRYRDTVGDDGIEECEVKDNAVGILVHTAQDDLPDGDDHDFGIEVTDIDGRLVYSAELTLRGRWA